MAAVLRDPWINTVVESELRAAFQSFQHSYVPGQPELEKGNRYCRPSGVEIRLSKQKQAQVIDFHGGVTSPHDAVLSDGAHRIHAIFDEDAAKSFTLHSARDFHGIKGGIIVIKKYHLIVNPALSPTRLSLRVLGFTLHGSEGSPVMGRPVDILTIPNVESLVSKLESLLVTPQDSTQAQLSPSTSQDKSSQPSVGFATQVNHINQRRLPSPISAPETITRDQDRLAALLGGVPKTSEVAVQKPVINVKQKSALGPVPERKVAAMNSRLDAKANVQRSQSYMPLSSSSSVQIGSVLKPVGSDILSQGHLHSSSDDNEKENSQERARHRKMRPDESESTEAVQQHTADFVDQLQRNDAFNGLKRVPRRYVRIPEDQRAILERSDCWYEPQAGDRLRYANVPAGVMDDLTRFRSRKSAGPRLQREGLDHSSSSDSEEDSGHDSAADHSESGDDDEESVDFRNSHKKPGGIDQQLQNNRSPPAATPNTKGHFPSSGPEIVDVADGRGDDSDEDGCPSWEATPEPEGELPEPMSDNDTQSQPQSIHPVGSAPYWKPRGQPYVRAPVNIPPSSPTMEEELELAVPHAVGDIVDPEDVQVEETAKPSLELPSTAPPTSTYIQVQRTPYVKSRSFDEASLRRSASGSKKAQDNVPSDPVIPATFNDTNSSGKQVSSSMDLVSADADLISGTRILHTGHSVVHSQTTTTHSQDIIVASSLQHTENTTEKVVAEKIVTSNHTESENLRASTDRFVEAIKCPSERIMAKEQTNHTGYVSPYPKLHAAGLANYVEQQRENEGESSKRIIAKPERHSDTALPRTHLTKGQRRMFFYDLEAEEDSLEGRAKDELLLEEIKKARDAKRNFKAKEKLTRRTSEIAIESPRRPSSSALVPVVSNPGKSMTPEADPQSTIGILLSPTPDSPSETDEPEEDTEYAHVRSSPIIDLDQFQDDKTVKETLPSRETLEPEYSSPIQPPSTGYHEQSPLQESVAFATPPRKLCVQRSPRESVGPESLSSAQPMADEENDQPSPRQSLGPGTPSSAQPQPDEYYDYISFGDLEPGSPLGRSQAEENSYQQPPRENMEAACSSPTESRRSENDERSPPVSAVPPSTVPSLDAQNMDNGPSIPGEVLRLVDSMPLRRPGSDAHPQPPPRQRFEPESLLPMKPPRSENPRKNSRAEEARNSKDLTFDGFVTTYPEYSGDKKCFARALVCLEWLRTKRIPPWSICDDFIRAYAEYEPFVRNLRKINPEKMMTAWEYYDSYVKSTVFERKFIDDENKLAAVLSSLNPLHVQTIRDAYNVPAAHNLHPEVPTKKGSKPAQKRVNSAITSPETAVTVADGSGANPELGFVDNLPRRHTRDPFFETPSQLHSIQQRKELDESTGLVLEAEGSDKRRRTLPWKQSHETRNQNASSLQSRRGPVFGRSEPNAGSTELKKGRQSNEQKRATLPPALRASSSKSSIIARKEPTRPESRDSEVLETRRASESVFQAARLSPELPDPTEKWVAQQLLADDPIAEEPRIVERSSVPRKDSMKGPVSARRESGLSSDTDSLGPTKKRRYRDLAEFAKDLGNRRRSELSSKSTPYPRAAKRVCTKPKGETTAKRVEPDAQAW